MDKLRDIARVIRSGESSDEEVHFHMRDGALRSLYYTSSTQLNHPRQQKFLSNEISEKVAKAIHGMVSAPQ